MKIYIIFKKFLIFLNFQNFENLGMLHSEEILGTPAAGNQKADVIPPPAPKKGTIREKPLCSDDLPADGDDINATLKAEIEKEHEDRMATMQELLAPLPPDASLADMEKRRVLLEEHMIKAAERK